MALDRFLNKEQVTGFTPTFGKTIEGVQTQELFLSDNKSRVTLI